ncbi:MAG TPA: hypothetical protein VIS76_06410 [Pseudomonadales bacterium]
MVASSPADVDRLFGELTNAGDVEGLVASFEPDATLVDGDLGALV